jgi:hypothetical protein
VLQLLSGRGSSFNRLRSNTEEIGTGRFHRNRRATGQKGLIFVYLQIKEKNI